MRYIDSVLANRGTRVAALAASAALLLAGSLTSVQADPGDPGDPDALVRINIEVINNGGGGANPS